MRHLRQLDDGHVGGESGDLEIRAVHLEQQSTVRRQRSVVIVGWVRLVVPTSTTRAPERAMMSGIRNDPPISTSSPRETTASPPRASALSASSTAPAALFTTSASAAPVSSTSRSRQIA